MEINIGETKDKLTVSANATESLGDVVSCLGHFIEFVVSEPELPAPPARKEINPFTVMMAAQRQSRFLPPPFPEVKANKKIKLKNDILEWCKKNELGWSSDSIMSEGKSFVCNLADAMWELDGHRQKLMERGCTVPSMFDQFVNYNKPEQSRHRKRAHSNLSKLKVEELSQTLFDTSGKAYMSKPNWKSVREAVLRLADNLRKYVKYLEERLEATNEGHARKTARTDVDLWTVYPASGMTPTKAARYKPLHDALRMAKPYQPIFVNEFSPTDRKRRHDYMKELVFPCKTVKYTYTGSSAFVHFVWKLDITHTETQIQQHNDDTKVKIKTELPVYHSRAMKREFMSTFGRLTGTKTGMLREMYRRLTGDSSAANYLSEEQVDERIREMVDAEDPDLIWDLRLTKSGRPEEYKEFLVKCQNYVASKVETAVDDRRHDPLTNEGESVTHLAMAISVRDLHEQVAAECDETVAIPSVQWLRLQFWPTKTSAAANRNTGRLKVKMMVCARQHRKHHMDTYYASAIFKYEKEFAVKFRSSTCFVCEDDKHTIKIGEPNFPVSAAERGKQVIVGLNQKMTVGDHDFTKLSFSPSVSFVAQIPETTDGSFYDGQVHVGIKENCFQPSSACRHASELDKLLPPTQPIECHYHDGGPDHNVRFARTQLTKIAYFLKRNLDMLISVQTPPHHSWKNPAERVMSNLNLGLQGVGVVRGEMPTMEPKVKSANNMKAIRDLAKKEADLEEEIIDCVQPAKVLLCNVFSRLQLKGKNFQIFEASSKDDMVELANQLKQIDDDFTADVLLDTSKPCKLTQKMKDFIKQHCVCGQYQLSIKKCGREDCVCGVPRSAPDVFAELHHLPFPVPQQEKYKHFEVIFL